MSEKLTVLFAAIDAAGHFNASIGLGGQLRDRGHKVVFATPSSWKGKLESQGFVEESYTTSETVDTEGEENSDKWAEMVSQMAPALAMSSADQLKYLVPPLMKEVVNQAKYSKARIREIVANVRPDLIVVDTIFQSLALVESGIPWILSISMNPTTISTKNLPPAFSGYATDGDRTEWVALEEQIKIIYSELFEDLNDWLRQNGGKEIEFTFPLFHNHSPYANIYMCPIELDYTMIRPNPPNWHRFDAFMRITNETFEIPKALENLPGKLIYFSMGTIGCGELGLMRKLVAILAKSPNRFIVSKGALADKFSLADNMWGAASLPQTKVLPLVDLVITHCGNNTLTESFYFGKRVIALPLFVDQWDNAQRIHETGLGLQFYPYKVTEDELLSGIETLLKDDLLERRMNTISKRIQASNSQSAAADLVEAVARKYIR